MSLSKNLTYLKTFAPLSFGFAANEISSAFPALNPTDIVSVTFEISGHPYFVTTGHISTPASGNAVSTYNKTFAEWKVKGTVTEVDSILSQLTFYPPDYPEARNYEPFDYSENNTSGNFPLDFDIPQPPTVNIGIIVRDVNDAYLGGFDTYADCELIDYVNQRPYWSVEMGPLNGPSTPSISGKVLFDFGEISHGSDTENLTITGQEVVWNSVDGNGNGTPLTSGQGYFVSGDALFIGDKKPVSNTAGNFTFTGSLDEVKSYLSGLYYYINSNEVASRQLLVKATDGIIGTWQEPYLVIQKSVTLSGVSNSFNFTEEVIGDLDFGNFSIPNASLFVDTNTMNYIVDVPHEYVKNIYHPSLSSTYDDQTGIFTIGLAVTYQNFSVAINALRDLKIEFYEDIAINFQGSFKVELGNSSEGYEYSSGLITFNVNMTDLPEFTNLFNNVTYTEDTKFLFGTDVPQISHSVNSNFDVDIETSDTLAGDFWIENTYTGSATFFRPQGHSLRIQGTRDDVNEALLNLYFAPNTDYNSNFTISYYQTRTSGDQTGFYNVAIGSNTAWTVTGVGTEEYTHSSLPNISWNEDQNTRFDIGLDIIDTSTDEPVLPLWDTDYQVTVRLKYWDGAASQPLTTAIIVCDTPNVTVSGTGTVADPLILTGKKADINAAVADLLLVPDMDWTTSPAADGSFWAEYKLVRLGDNTTFANYNDAKTFNAGTQTVDFFNYNLQNVDWYEDVAKDFDTGFEIRDYAGSNPYYPVFGTEYTVALALYYDDNGVETPFNDGTLSVDPTTLAGTAASVSGNGTDASPLFINGTREDVNVCLKNIRFVADNDITSAPDGGDFYVKGTYDRDRDGLYVDEEYSDINYVDIESPFGAEESITFNTAIAHDEFALPSSMYYLDVSKVIEETQEPFSLYRYSNGMAMQILDQVGDETTETYVVTINTPIDGDVYLEGFLRTPDSTTTTKEYIFSGTRQSLNTTFEGFNYTNDPVGNILTVDVYRNSDAKVIFTGSSSLICLQVPTVSSVSGNSTKANIQDTQPIVFDLNNPRNANIENVSLSVSNYTDNTKLYSLTKVNSSYILDETDYSFITNTSNITVTYNPVVDNILMRPYVEVLNLNSNVRFLENTNFSFTMSQITNDRDLYSLTGILSTSDKLIQNFDAANWSTFRSDELTSMRMKKASFYDGGTTLFGNPTYSGIVEYGTALSGYNDNFYYAFATSDEFPIYQDNNFYASNTNSKTASNKNKLYVWSGLDRTLNQVQNINYSSQKTISFDLGFNNAKILDTLYDHSQNRFYVLVSINDYTETRLYYINTDPNGYDFAAGASLTLLKTVNGTLNGALGKIHTGEVVAVIGDDIANDTYVYHQNTNGVDAFGIFQTLGINMPSYSESYYFGSRKYVQMNTNNYMLIGGAIYYFNATLWVVFRTTPYNFATSNTTRQNQALLKDFYVSSYDNKIFKLVNGIAEEYYDYAAADEVASYSKYDNILLMMDGTTNSLQHSYRILRLTK